MVATMRVVIPAFLALSVSIIGTATGAPRCTFGDDLTTTAQTSAALPAYSDFRGISLGSTPKEVQRRARALGFSVYVTLFVGDASAIAGVEIYRNWETLGRADFDRSGRMLRLSLKDGFFCDAPVFVRRFADSLFEHYDVEPLKVEDDVCFQDVTCFKGVSKLGEQFLILRIGTAAELYVRPQ